MRKMLLVLELAASASVQWLDRKTAGMPRTADGKPDLSGIWMVPGLKYLINIAADLKPEEVSFSAVGGD